jgi:prephenate dehydrogenase
MGFLFQRVALIGVGMVGGSLGRAMLSRGLAREVVGIDTQPGVLKQALALGAVNRAASSLAEGVAGADLVVLAAPVMASIGLLPAIASHLSQGAIVTDVCSTKAEITKIAVATLPATTCFVGGHPMAGSEKDGVNALDENLFENAVYVLTAEAVKGMQLEPYQRVRTLVQELGAMVVEMDALQHDRVATYVSHLPHMAASVLAETVSANMDDRERIITLASGGFRDTTRIAMGNPQMWKDICLTNREQIVGLMERYIQELTDVRALVAAADGTGLVKHFERAKEFRLQVPSRGKGILPVIYNLYVYVPDKPGIIGEVAGFLGQGGVNIAEIELLRVREEEGGPLRLGFAHEESRRLGAGLLEAQGFRTGMQEDV